MRRAAIVLGVVLLVAGCGDTEGDGDAELDPVAAAEQRVERAESELEGAQTDFDDASSTFCADSEAYVDAVDRYGSAFSDAEATVGDVTVAGADLEAPREDVEGSADAVLDARDALAAAEQELIDAEAALAAAQTGTTAPEADDTTSSTVPLVPEASVDRVTEAEADLAAAFEGVSADTPLAEATEEVNAAAFAVQVAWLRLFADAGCLGEEQQAEAVTAIAEYTTALQSSLTAAGVYSGAIDGVYGPATVAAVEQLQTDSGLPVTGLVDRATAAALEQAVVDAGGPAAAEAIAHTAALQSVLTLTGYWTGPIDGEWTDALTAALQEAQTDLGVPDTGVVDAATLAALQQAIEDAQAGDTTSTTTESEESEESGDATTTTES